MLFSKTFKNFQKLSTSLIFFLTLFNSGISNVFANERYNSSLTIYQTNNNVNSIADIQKKNKSIDNNSLNPSLIERIKDIKNRNKKVIKLIDLEDLIKANSEELKVMKFRIEESKLLLKSEISSWYPNLNLSSTGLPQYLNGNSYNELSTNTSSNQTKASLKATLTWDLINPARIPQISEAKDNLENAHIAYSIKYLDLLLEARSEFFKLQQSLQDIRIAKDSLKTSKISLKEASIKLKSGLGSKFDLLEAKTQLSKDKQSLIEKLGLRKINERKLVQILNLHPNTIPIIDSMPKIIGIWESSLEESINSGYEYREELDQLLLQISINNNKANLALGSSQPTISIYNTVDSSISKGELAVPSPRGNNTINNFTNTIGLQFNWPIFDGGSSKAKYYAKKEKVKEIETQLSIKKTEIRNEIEKIFIKMNTAKENIKNSYDAIQSAKESLRLSILRLKAGITTQREVFNNQKDLTQAEVNHVNAITEYNKNITSLQRETGINEFKSCRLNKQSDNQLTDGIEIDLLTLTKDSCMELL